MRSCEDSGRRSAAVWPGQERSLPQSSRSFPFWRWRRRRTPRWRRRIGRRPTIRRRNANDQLIRLNVATGERLVDQDDLFGALPWYTEALRLAHRQRKDETVHRTRIAATWAATPKVVQLWWHPGGAASADISADG